MNQSSVGRNPSTRAIDGQSGASFAALSLKLGRLVRADLPRLLAMTRDVLASCGCESGCPACCLSARCGNDNQPMDKAGAAALAAELLAGAS